MSDKKDIQLPQWLESRKRPLLYTSATQIETFQMCPRKWWLERVRKLAPEFATSAQVLGTVLHSVIERFLRADDTGRDRDTGQEVDLYPEGWEHAESKFGQPSEGSIDLGEQEIVKKLIKEAIASGVLERLPGREIELSFDILLTEAPCSACGGDGLGANTEIPCEVCNGEGKTKVRSKGFIDQIDDIGIQDHKTLKRMAYAKSKEALKKNTQILLYAYVYILRRREQNKPLPKDIYLRHNQFCKDPEDLRVRKTEVSVPVQYVEDWAERVLIPTVIRMAHIRQRIEAWHEIPEPENKREACNAYGGCFFVPICSGRVSEESFEKALARQAGLQDSSAYTPTATVQGVVVPKALPPGNTGLLRSLVNQVAAPQEGKDHEMSKFASTLARMSAAGAAPKPSTAPAINPPPQAAVVQAPVATPPAAPAAAPAAPVAPVAAPAAPAAPTLVAQPFVFNIPAGAEMPPWANPQCGACKGKGFNTVGKPCMLCSNVAHKRNDGTSPEHFFIEATGDGWFVWEARDGSSAGQAPAPTAAVQVKAEVRQETAPTPPPVVEAPAPTPPPAPAPEQPETEKTSEEKRGKAGRPKKGFILLINCGVLKGEMAKTTSGGRGVHRLHEMLPEIQEALAKQQGVASFYDLDPFKRKEAFARSAALIAEEFGTDFVEASGIGTGMSDLRALFDAIRPLASMEIGAIGGM